MCFADVQEETRKMLIEYQMQHQRDMEEKRRRVSTEREQRVGLKGSQSSMRCFEWDSYGSFGHGVS